MTEDLIIFAILGAWILCLGAAYYHACDERYKYMRRCKDLEDRLKGIPKIKAPDIPRPIARGISDDDIIDWEQRRYEIAKEVFPFASKLTTDILGSGRKVEGSAGKTVMQVCAETALNYTDALIEELKKTAQGDSHE